MDYFQTLRAQALIEQYDYCSNPANIATFQNPLMLIPFVIFRWESGYIRFDDGTLSYKDLSTGKCFLVRTTRNNNKDYSCFQELNEIGLRTGSFRFSNILCREILDNGRIEYIEISPPNDETGITVTTDFISTPPTMSFVKNYIDIMKSLLNAATVVSAKNNIGFPDCEDLGYYPTMLRDSVGYYWNPVLNWNSSKDETITEILSLFDGLTSNGVMNGFFTLSEKTEILNYARTSWQ